MDLLLMMLSPMLIFGIHTIYVVIAVAVVVALVVVAVVLGQRRQRPKFELRDLEAGTAERYVEEFAAIEREFLDHPEQAAARARGVAEEVMRRRGFPDRIEPKQRISDLGFHDKEAARSLQAANSNLGGAGENTERLRQVVQHYRALVYRLTGTPMDRVV